MVGVIAVVLFAVFWIMGVTRETWASHTYSARHPYAITFRGGTTLYFAEWPGWFLAQLILDWNWLWVNTNITINITNNCGAP